MTTDLDFIRKDQHTIVESANFYMSSDGNLCVSVTNIINMQDESCGMELNAEQTAQLLKMLTEAQVEK